MDRDEIYEGELFEKTVSSENVFEGRVFTAKVLDVELPDGSPAKREIICHRGGATIVPVDAEGNVYMVKQFRIATGKVLLETPAGKLEEGEDPFECARRELTEETGLLAEKISHLSAYYPTPGYCNEVINIYLAQGLTQTHPHRDEGEFLHIVKMPLEEAVAMVTSGAIEDSKTMLGLLLAKEAIARSLRA
ncbi:MAG: NUDIX hydrolase [Clostridia bacterium]|nr:NUDIX hydrolase [Clostridia bacterium]